MIDVAFLKLPSVDAAGFEISMEIRNLTDQAIADLRISLDYEIDRQVAQVGDSSASSNWAVTINEIVPFDEGPLPPFESRQFFVAGVEAMPELLSELDSLSSDNYEIIIWGNGDVLRRISGRDFGGWVDRNFNQ